MLPAMVTPRGEAGRPRQGRMRAVLDHSLTAKDYARAIGHVVRQRLPQLRLVWIDEQTIQIGDTQFYVTFEPSDLLSVKSTSDRFLFAKAPNLVHNLLDVAPTSVRNIVDLGIYQGGSVAFYAKLFDPDRLVAVELSPTRVPALDEFVDIHELTQIVRLYYGVDQGDQAAMRDLLQQNFAPRSLDLVIDDCSHLYDETKASLNVLLPWVRPGGVYIIEDWAWAHWPGEPWQVVDGGYAPGRPALSNLIFELLMLSASRQDLISQIKIEANVVTLIRGEGVIDETDFDISSSYLTRGRGFSPIL
jgi:SAM-dependent methyltransferase